MIGRLIDWIFSSIAFSITCVIALIMLGVALKYWPCLLFGLLLVVVWHLETVWNRRKKPKKITIDKNYIRNKRKDELAVLGIFAFVIFVFIFAAVFVAFE